MWIYLYGGIYNMINMIESMVCDLLTLFTIYMQTDHYIQAQPINPQQSKDSYDFYTTLVLQNTELMVMMLPA